MTHLVMFNGPIGAGKTWMVAALYKKLMETGYRVNTLNFKQPLIMELAVRWQHENDDGPLPTYTELRDWILSDGRSGRQFMIDQGNYYEDHEPYKLAEEYVRNVMKLQEYQFILTDDCGKPLEFTTPQAERKTLIYMESRPSPRHKYLHGEKFQNDSRFCLVGFSDLHPDPTLEEIYWHITRI